MTSSRVVIIVIIGRWILIANTCFLLVKDISCRFLSSSRAMRMVLEMYLIMTLGKKKISLNQAVFLNLVKSFFFFHH